MASIRKRKWRTSKGELRQAWMVDYFDSEGVRRRKAFDKKAKAQEWLNETLHAVKEGTHTPDSISGTLGEACERWLARGEAEGRERSTLEQRRQHVRLHILPLLDADTKLSRLTLARVEQFRDDLLRTRSLPMARKVLTSLKSILSTARKLGLVAQNVAADVRIEVNGRHDRKLEVGRDIPTKAEVTAMLTTATGYIRPLVHVAALCGLRMSEIRGLRWSDVDFDKRLIHVRQRADKWNRIGAPKSRGSYRAVPMATVVANTLKEWKLACPKGELVFPNGRGNVESLANIWNRHLAPLQVAAGVADPVLDDDGKPVLDDQDEPVVRAKYGAHSLRHFYASWLIDQGFNAKRVQTLMGHSTIQITFDTYGHLFPQEGDHDRFSEAALALVA